MESTGEKKMVSQGWSGPAEAGSREVESSAEKKGRGPLYPVRPHEPDCAFYLRTGYCRYGAGCRFNHPMKKMVKLENPSKTAAQVAEENPERVGKMECKFYSLPGGCRYGNACKFVHCKEKTDKEQTEKTDKGQTGSRTIRFPIRPEDVECPQYMVAGYCKLSAACKFQHPPLPSSVVCQNTSEFIFWGSRTFSGYANGGSGRVASRALPLVETFEQPLQSSFDASLPYQVYNKPGQNPVVSTSSSPKGIVKYSRVPTMPKAGVTTNQEGNTEEHPDSAFRFNLLNRYLISTPRVTVSPVGLPLRPDQPVCKYYGRFGLCKYGIGCQFDHPVNCGSLIAQSSGQAPTSNNTGKNGSQ